MSGPALQMTDVIWQKRALICNVAARFGLELEKFGNLPLADPPSVTWLERRVIAPRTV